MLVAPAPRHNTMAVALLLAGWTAAPGRWLELPAGGIAVGAPLSSIRRGVRGLPHLDRFPREHNVQQFLPIHAGSATPGAGEFRRSRGAAVGQCDLRSAAPGDSRGMGSQIGPRDLASRACLGNVG